LKKAMKACLKCGAAAIVANDGSPAVANNMGYISTNLWYNSRNAASTLLQAGFSAIQRGRSSKMNSAPDERSGNARQRRYAAAYDRPTEWLDGYSYMTSILVLLITSTCILTLSTTTVYLALEWIPWLYFDWLAIWSYWASQSCTFFRGERRDRSRDSVTFITPSARSTS
jgi:hypothetical protein